MSAIDERVVAMRFQDSQFAQGIKRTLDALGSLKTALNMDGAKQSLQSLDDAGKRFNLANIGTAAEGVSAKFIAMATIAITALASIAAKAVQVGTQMISSLTIDPIKQGLQEYETNLNAIQTILANTQSKGTTLDDVGAALQELNEYSDKTIYNFSEMARNIGTFTAAGVELGTATEAIKGIANLAALSGSNSQQASTAMYQLSQAMSSGTVKLMDWNSVVNAGMGGQVFQDALKETARNQGVAIDGIIEKNGSFRDSLQEGWLTTDILTATLAKFTGDLTREQLESMGYTEDQIAGILQMGETASDAATKVKTMTQLLGTLKESAQSGWSQTWQIVAGDFEEAKAMWTGVNDVLGGMIGASADARNELLQAWKDGGGRDMAIQSVINAFNALMAIITPIKEAFREIFPPATADQLITMTRWLQEFTNGLIIGGETSGKIKRVFAGLFAAFDIGIEVVKAIIGVFADLTGGVGETAGDFLDFSAGIGDWIVNLRDAVKNGEGFKAFFDTLSEKLQKIIGVVKEVVQFFGDLFKIGAESGAAGVTGAVDQITERLSPLQALGGVIIAIWSRIGAAFERLWQMFYPIAQNIGEFFSTFAQMITGSMENVDYDSLLDTINTGLFAGLVLIMRNFLNNGINVDVGGGFLDQAREALAGVTGTLEAMQQNLKADTLMKIATALGILTLSVVGLSLIDSEALTRAIVALTAMFVQLGTAMYAFEQIGTVKSAAKMIILGAAMTIMATAILILTAAVKVLSTMEWEEMARGLTGVIVLLGAMAGAAKLMTMNSGGLISAGLGMIAVAIAIKILASAVADFAAMSWEDMARGLAGVAATLLALGLFTKLMDANKAGVSSGVGLILLAAALKIMASAVGDFADMDYETLARGIGSIAVMLGIIAGALALMQGTLAGSAALLIVSASLVVLSQVLKQMGGMSWEEIAKGLVTLAGALLIIAGAMYLMVGALPGALALIVVAGALALLGPVLLGMAQLSWEEIGAGLAMLAGVFLVLGLAGLALTPVIPTLLGLGLAITLIGVGVLAAGVGLLAFSVGLTALAAASAVGTAAIVAMVAAIIGLIPMAMAALAQGIVLFVGVIAQSGPQFVLAITAVLLALIDAIAAVTPRVIEVLVSLVMQLVDVLATNVPILVDKGLQMVNGILEGLGKNLGGIIDAATKIITELLNGLGRNIPKIVQAGVDLVISLVNGLANGIRDNTSRMEAAGRNLASAIIEGMTGGISRGISTVISAVKDMATGALNAAKKALGINSPSREFFKVGVWSDEGLAGGLVKTAGVVARAAGGVAKGALNAMKSGMSRVAELVATDMDMSPTIRPVLDLTDVQKGTGQMAALMRNAELNPTASYEQAAAISVSNDERQQALAQAELDGSDGDDRSITYIQNNNSPKALSNAEIYRSTKNQLSKTRGGLPT